MDEAYEQKVEQAEQASQRGDFETAFRHLERAHVPAQRVTGRHTYIHWRMLVAGLRSGDAREVVGQVPRIVASILFSRLWVPRGNSGRARVSAFKPVPVPRDLQHLVRYRRATTARHASIGTPIDFEVTHPFHPWQGKRFVLATRKLNWGEDRVTFFDANGHLRSLPASWTNVDEPDEFTRVAAGRARLRIDDLARLRVLVDEIRGALQQRRRVKEHTPRK